MANGQEDITKHKLLINCPVAQNPDIFTKVNGSIEALRKTVEQVIKDAKEAKEVVYATKEIADSAKKRVDYLYWFFGTFSGLLAAGSLIYHFLVG